MAAAFSSLHRHQLATAAGTSQRPAAMWGDPRPRASTRMPVQPRTRLVCDGPRDRDEDLSSWELGMVQGRVASSRGFCSIAELDGMAGGGSHEPGGPIASRIEEIIRDVAVVLRQNRTLEISTRSRVTGNEVATRFPNGTTAGSRRFTALLFVAHLIREALVTKSVITKRNIYYQNPTLFRNQGYVDRIIDDLAFTFGVGRDALNVVAAEKGLIAGGGFGAGQDNNGGPIPQARTVDSVLDGFDPQLTRWVLVIEKEATFRGLAASNYHETSQAGRGMIVTAKGYPDLATRRFLHSVHHAHRSIPLLALVDFDPDGFGILHTYKHGSSALAHEENIAIPGLSWLGVKSIDVLPAPARTSSTPNSHQSLTLTSQSSSRSRSSHIGCTRLDLNALAEHNLRPLTYRDRKKAASILRIFQARGTHSAEEMTLRREVQLMLILDKKAEIQAVDEAGDLTDWLDARLCDSLSWATDDDLE